MRWKFYNDYNSFIVGNNNNWTNVLQYVYS